MSMPKNSVRNSGLISGVLGFTGVLLGAFGAHALKVQLETAGMADIWRTAVEYQLAHAVALLALTVWIELRLQRPEQGNAAGVKWLIWAGRCWTAGVVCFSGSLYALALGGPRWLGPITPLGGLALLAGWVLVVLATLRAFNNK